MPRPERLIEELDWNLLHTFVVITQAGSISEAAFMLGRKQPTISAALQRLEATLNRQLIDRAPGRFVLTEAGQTLLQHAIGIHAQVERLSTVMRQTSDEVSGEVVIALASHVACPLFDRALAIFHARHPRARVTINVQPSPEAVTAVATGRAALAICLVRERPPRLSFECLYRERFGLFCGPPHPLFGRENLQIGELAGRASVSFDTDRMHGVLRLVTLMRANADLHDHVVGSSSALEEVRRMIIAGMGIGPMPLHVAQRDVDDGLLWPLPPFKDLPELDVFVISNPKSPLNRAEVSMLSLIREQIKNTPLAQRSY